ncbi:hypothetical protein T261_8044 [Streptomyces lydicus]|nr:hypothetical protein T261_8044 [Streptomyces lydicus]
MLDVVGRADRASFDCAVVDAFESTGRAAVNTVWWRRLSQEP